ncbi:DUF4192 family protein [Arthrobacter sp. YD2]|uniref:DUF4192 family protein n=1 Tax=Arthrobacter sp. YD2 TaxID=3058046 RepID=UPI0025B3958B|nr:DUF4192 family protein [Arthrobacter sp. YD2]MDN3904919.1 DUF4192 family protein [Arthrobacter sp. YD2]
MSTEPADGTAENPYRVSDPADILSLIPHTLGFEPRESLVLLALCSGRLGATLRLDLPPVRAASKAGANAAYAAAAARFLAADTRADGALLVLYTGAPWTEPARPPFLALIRRLEKELAAVSLPVQDGWMVGPEYWRDYFCTRPGCCPWPGMPRSQITDSTLNTELVYRGSAFAPSLEQAVGSSRARPWSRRQEVADAQARFAKLLGDRWCERDQFGGTLRLWAACFSPGVPDSGQDLAGGNPGLREAPETAGFLLASLRDRGIRDSVLVLAAVGLETALAGAEAHGLLRCQGSPAVFPRDALGLGAGCDGTPDATALSGTGEPPGSGVAGTGARTGRARTGRARTGPASPGGPIPRGAAPGQAAGYFRGILVGRGGGTPDWPLLDRANNVFTDLAAASEGEARAALLSLLAWIEWARGRGSRAHVYLEQSLAAQPGYRLALLLGELLGTGVLPDWARSRSESWPGAGNDPRPGGAG